MYYYNTYLYRYIHRCNCVLLCTNYSQLYINMYSYTHTCKYITCTHTRTHIHASILHVQLHTYMQVYYMYTHTYMQVCTVYVLHATVISHFFNRSASKDKHIKYLSKYHPGVYSLTNKDRWSCCGRALRESEGCSDTTGN